MGGSFYASFLQCDEHYQDWSGIDTIHVTGSAIVPSSEYFVQMVKRNDAGFLCGAGEVVRVTTSRWADVQVPFRPPSTTVQPDLSDVSAMITKFRNAPGRISKTRAILVGDGNVGSISSNALNMDVDFNHIAACVDAFRGRPYPHTIESCP